MPNNQKQPEKNDTVAVLCRFSEADIEFMKRDTMATASATAVNIFCRKHIAEAKKDGRRK